MHWKNTEERTDERAVSPVIGVIMMVAVTVILAAIVSMLVLGMGQDVDNSAQASFSFDYDAGAGTLEVTHDGGDALDAVDVAILVDGTEDADDTWTSDPITAGSSYTVGTVTNLAGGETVKVVWTGENGETHTLATYKVPT